MFTGWFVQNAVQWNFGETCIWRCSPEPIVRAIFSQTSTSDGRDMAPPSKWCQATRFDLHIRKLAWNLKMDPWKMISLLETRHFHAFSGSMLFFGTVFHFLFSKVASVRTASRQRWRTTIGFEFWGSSHVTGDQSTCVLPRCGMESRSGGIVDEVFFPKSWFSYSSLTRFSNEVHDWKATSWCISCTWMLVHYIPRILSHGVLWKQTMGHA